MTVRINLIILFYRGQAREASVMLLETVSKRHAHALSLLLKELFNLTRELQSLVAVKEIQAK